MPYGRMKGRPVNRIDKTFKLLRRARKKAFIAYLTAGDPNLGITARLALALEQAGVDIIEFGVPFSDPLADGETIQAASQRALKAKTNLPGIFAMVKGLREKTEIPIALMTYYNPVFKYGLDKFIADCVRNGVDGVIIPDLPFEEAAPIARLAKKSGIALIFLCAPTSTKNRIKNIARYSTGFIYYVSLTGVTGARAALPADLISKLRQVKRATRKPVCVGFGISRAEQAANAARAADGIIVGSAIVKVIENNLGNPSLADKVYAFASRLANAIHDV